jgi:hypothetical protein
MSNIIKFQKPSNAVRAFEDTPRYKGGFGVNSESSNAVYKISFDAAPGAMYWVCSCRGYIRWGQCKHLTACGLQGRKYGKQLADAKKYGWLV